MPRVSCLAFLLVSVTAASLSAQPSVSHTVPAAVQPGKTVELTLHGAKLDDPLHVWTSFPAQVELVPAEEGKKDLASRTCKVTLDAATAVGIGGLVVGNPAGTSEVLLLSIDDLGSVADAGNNHDAASAQVLTLPIAVDGVSDGNRFDYYKFSAQAGQRVAVEVLAARVASNYDPVVRLLDSQGQELQYADDDPSFGADCRFAHTFAAAGEYLLEVYDNQYRGGGRYRLRVGDFPLVSVPYPLGGRLGSTAKFDFAGPATDGTAAVLLRIPDDVATGRVPLSVRFPDGKSSATATLVASHLPEAVETEPNDAAKAAGLITLPCAVNGILSAAGDRDFYKFAAMKGQAFAFRGVSRSLGSPSLLFLRVTDADGKQLAETQVNNEEEFTLAHTFPADGMYCLAVEDLLHRGGPEFAYRVEIEPNIGFSLSLKNDKATQIKFITPLKTGAFAVDVQVARRGYDGPITLALENASADFRLFAPVIPDGAKAHRLIVAVGEGAQAGDLHALRIVGRAETGGRELSSVVQTGELVRARQPLVSFPPAWLDGLLTIATGGEVAAFFDTKLDADPVAFPADKGEVQFTLALERKDKDFKDAVTVVLEGLPDAFSYAVKQDKDNYQVTIKGPKTAPAARHAFRVVGYGAHKGSGQIVIKDAALEVAAAAGG